MPHTDSDRPILLAMVPGMGLGATDFHMRRLVAEAERRGWCMKVAVIDPGPDSYLDNTVEARMLHAIAEARPRAGASRLWLAGISLGCQGVLRCVWARPGLADGLLLTPYLTSTGLFPEVARAGGLRQWAATDHSRKDKPEQALLAWLAATPSPALPPMLVGQAMKDGFARTARILGVLLPEDRMISVPGAHYWKSWTALWRLMQDRNPFDLPMAVAK